MGTLKDSYNKTVQYISGKLLRLKRSWNALSLVSDFDILLLRLKKHLVLSNCVLELDVETMSYNTGR